MSVTDDRMARMSLTRAVPKIARDGLPPGPGWPVLVQSTALLRFRHTFVPWAHRKYGDTFTVSLLPGGRKLVIFSRPEAIKEIFAGDPEVFHAGKGNAILGPIMGEHSLLLVDSAQHKRARKLLMPAFGHAPLKGYEQIVTAIAKTECDAWEAGVPFRSLERMNALTLEVIMRVVFGVTDDSRLAELRPLVNRTVNVGPHILLGWGYPRLQRFGPWKATVENQRRFDAVLYAEIAERRRATDLAARTDVLSQLLLVGDHEGEQPLNDNELRDQLVTLLLAGHETTASALSWALYELGRSPALLAKAQRAADDGDDAYLEAVVKESMRLHPVIPMVVRLLMAPAKVGGYDLPAGVNVGPSIILSHLHNFDDATSFRPERFLDTKIPANTWIPFGGGVRRCIGAGFSLMEGVAVLREVLLRYDVTTDGHDVPKVRNITSVPKRGAPIRVTPRGQLLSAG